MFVPFISKPRSLEKRKGGGGGKSGGGSTSSSSSGGKSSGGKSSGSSSSSSSSGSGRTSSISSSSTGGKTVRSYGNGGGPVTTIPSGSLFSGRTQGGGTRQQVYGTSVYGSGYPGLGNQRGTAGLGFPFYFWPVTWGAAGFGGAAYLHHNEYGRADNSSRPGGVQTMATFTSNSTDDVFYVVSDNTTVTELIEDIRHNCTLNFGQTSLQPSNYNDSDPNAPAPESTIQYYRASSVALVLKGYNNTAALSNDSSQAQTPLPSDIDTTLLNCLNDTIALAVPLVDGAFPTFNTPNTGLLALIWVVWCFSHVA